MRPVVFSESAAKGTTSELALRVRAHLCRIAGHSSPITYQTLAKALGLAPPNTIHQLTIALEYLIEEDAAAARPLIAAVMVSKTQGGLPAPGFFECEQRVGRFYGDPSGPEIPTCYSAEFDAAVEYWRAAPKVVESDASVIKPS